jgi:hypothetical protein
VLPVLQLLLRVPPLLLHGQLLLLPVRLLWAEALLLGVLRDEAVSVHVHQTLRCARQ